MSAHGRSEARIPQRVTHGSSDELDRLVAAAMFVLPLLALLLIWQAWCAAST